MQKDSLPAAAHKCVDCIDSLVAQCIDSGQSPCVTGTSEKVAERNGEGNSSSIGSLAFSGSWSCLMEVARTQMCLQATAGVVVR